MEVESVKGVKLALRALNASRQLFVAWDLGIGCVNELQVNWFVFSDAKNGWFGFSIKKAAPEEAAF